MAKTSSNVPREPLSQRLKAQFRRLRRKIAQNRAPHNPHRSFHRSYREDYQRETQTPGLLAHAAATFQLLFQNWRTFLPLILIFVALDVVFVGLMSEEFYQQFQTTIDETSAELGQGELSNFARAGLLLISTVTSGGLDAGMGDTQTVMLILIFLALWLVTIFLLRHFLAGSRPRLRDGLYNALAPLISTLLVLIVVFVQMIPLMLVVITYSAAVATGFLSTPFYALVYFIFAALMILISTCLVSSSLIALIAVTAPGVYPMVALNSASDLAAGRRTHIVLRVVYLIIVIAFIYFVTMLPIILIDLWLKSVWAWLEGWPIVPFFLLLVTCFVFVYAAAYLYQYYRWLLDAGEKEKGEKKPHKLRRRDKKKAGDPAPESPSAPNFPQDAPSKSSETSKTPKISKSPQTPKTSQSPKSPKTPRKRSAKLPRKTSRRARRSR